MMTPRKRQTPAARRGFANNTHIYGDKYTTRNGSAKANQTNTAAAHFRGLPLPLDYYTRALGTNLRINNAGWAQARCPFHNDRNSSLSVRLTGSGAWLCFAGCGKGDLISFHMKLTRLRFAAALSDLRRR